MHEGVSYMDDIDIYYYHCHVDESEIINLKDKWYKISCILYLPNLPIHKNVYFVPNTKLEEFFKFNCERLIDIEPISYEEIINYINYK